jgi:hypothetical protein
VFRRVPEGRLRLKCDGTRAETRFRLSAKRTSPFKSAGTSVQSTTGRRAVRISLQGLYCSCRPVFCSHVTLTGYPLHSLVSPSPLLPCVTVYHHISEAVYICRHMRPVNHLHLEPRTPLGSRVMVKMKFTLEQAMKFQKGNRGTALLVL